MIIFRPPNRMIAERDRQERAAQDAKGPRPISTVGGGRGGSLMAFTQATGTANGRLTSRPLATGPVGMTQPVARRSLFSGLRLSSVMLKTSASRPSGPPLTPSIQTDTSARWTATVVKTSCLALLSGRTTVLIAVECIRVSVLTPVTTCGLKNSTL